MPGRITERRGMLLYAASVDVCARGGSTADYNCGPPSAIWDSAVDICILYFFFFKEFRRYPLCG